MDACYIDDTELRVTADADQASLPIWVRQAPRRRVRKALPRFGDEDVDRMIALLPQLAFLRRAAVDPEDARARGIAERLESDRFVAKLSRDAAARFEERWWNEYWRRRSTLEPLEEIVPRPAPLPRKQNASGEEGRPAAGAAAEPTAEAIWWLNDWDMGVYHDGATGETRWATDDDWRRVGDLERGFAALQGRVGGAFRREPTHEPSSRPEYPRPEYLNPVHLQPVAPPPPRRKRYPRPAYALLWLWCRCELFLADRFRR